MENVRLRLARRPTAFHIGTLCDNQQRNFLAFMSAQQYPDVCFKHEGINMSLETANVINNVANIFLAVSLAVGLISTVAISWTGNIKEEALKRDLAAANIQAAQANERAAEANKKAEEERLARIKIEARIAPRTMTQAQQNEITDKLAHLPKQTGIVRAAPSTPESEMFARVLSAPLNAAGWDMTPAQGSPTATILFPTGVIINWAMDWTHPNMSEQGDRAVAAETLAGILNELGIAASVAYCLRFERH